MLCCDQGLWSIARSDVVHWSREDCDWGGGGQYVNQASFEAVAAGLQRSDLLDVVKIWQLDDWWYETGTGGVYSACVRNWTLPPATFPSGLKGLSKTLKTPWLLCERSHFQNAFVVSD